MFPGSFDRTQPGMLYEHDVTSLLMSTDLISKNKGQENWERIKMVKHCFFLQIVKTVSDARDKAVGVFGAIFPSQQEGRSS